MIGFQKAFPFFKSKQNNNPRVIRQCFVSVILGSSYFHNDSIRQKMQANEAIQRTLSSWGSLSYLWQSLTERYITIRGKLFLLQIQSIWFLQFPTGYWLNDWTQSPYESQKSDKRDIKSYSKCNDERPVSGWPGKQSFFWDAIVISISRFAALIQPQIHCIT